MTVTLRDVAVKSGVSIRTVSNVVNGYAPVAEATRLRVQATIDALGYRPNLMARNLKQGRSRVIALVVPELDVPYFAELTRLVIAEARAHGYTVIIDQTDGDELQERELVVQNSRALGFDGVILSPVALSQSDLSARATTVPIVLLGERISSSGVDHVAIDNVAAAREATTHLISRGRRRIAAIGDQPYNTGETAQLRTIGYRQAHEQAGMKVDDTLVVQTNRFHRENGARAMTELLALESRPDAIFCYNDLLALGAMRVALTHALRIPEDLAVVGFDNIEDGQYSTPTLTTVAPDKHEIARQAVTQLIARIDSTDANEPREIRAGYNLVVRESTAGAGSESTL